MGREISQLGLCKGPKHELTDEFYGFIKSRKRSIFVIDSYLKDSAFTKRDAKFQTRYVKEYHLSIEGIRKGYLFREKGVGPRGGASPYKISSNGVFVKRARKDLRAS